MMLYFPVGILLGGAAAIFAVQNTQTVAITFLSWQLEAPIAAIVIASVLSGIGILLVLMLPQYVRQALDQFALSWQPKPDGASGIAQPAVQESRNASPMFR